MVVGLIKLVHTGIFGVLSAGVLEVVYAARTNRVTKGTKLALVAISIEGAILLVNHGRCPLTKVAETCGAHHGAVSDMFLPNWCAPHVFSVCTPLFLAACGVLGVRQWWAHTAQYRALRFGVQPVAAYPL
jgi:hypothetical protein